MKTNRPTIGEVVTWNCNIRWATDKNKYSVVVSKVKVRDKVAKILPNGKAKKTMPFQYFWVDFNEIGY